MFCRSALKRCRHPPSVTQVRACTFPIPDPDLLIPELPGQPAQGADLATPDRVVVSSLDDVEVQRRVGQPDLEQGAAQGLRAEVKEGLIGGSGVDPYAAQ